MNPTHKVQIIENSTGETIKEIDCGSDMMKAIKINNALNVNLNHDKFTVAITFGSVSDANK